MSASDLFWPEDPLPYPSTPTGHVIDVEPTAIPSRRMARPRGRAAIPLARIRAMNDLVNDLAGRVCRGHGHGVCPACKARAILGRWPLMRRKGRS
jgi:hypothetical protein